jgi:N-acetylmuramoyl-L-alanine amidase
MILVIHKKKLILAILAILTLSILAYFDLRQRTEVFFKTAHQEGVKTIILDPGHGGEDPGAVSDYSQTKEKEINLIIATKLKTLLEEEGYRVWMTRTEDVLQYEEGTSNVVAKRRQDLERRKKFIDESNADLAVSIHLNKFPQTKYYGAQVFYPPNFSESKKLAQTIQQSIREYVDPNNKREALVKKEPIIILKNPKVTTAIVECGFLSNEEEEMKLLTESHQDKLAKAIKEGIKAYLSGS